MRDGLIARRKKRLKRRPNVGPEVVPAPQLNDRRYYIKVLP